MSDVIDKHLLGHKKSKTETPYKYKKGQKKRTELGQKIETQMDGLQNCQTDEQTIIDEKIWNNLFLKICMTDCASVNRLW